MPNGLPADVAAPTEPMAIGFNAVWRGEVGRGTVAVVIGCGPIGLAVISGANLVIDPTEKSPYAAFERGGLLRTLPEGVELLVGTLERLQQLRLPWCHVQRAVDKLCLGPQDPVSAVTVASTLR
ncbi:MAG: hypothetical protein M3063_08280 [Actinomycetota bacterium]|nr:hypothetical protein [Actinomycetota bacterium]